MGYSSCSNIASSHSTGSSRRWVINRLVEPSDSRDHIREFAEAVQNGLVSQPRTLPWPYFYDAEGSRLFEQICEQSEYYLTRTEDRILQQHATEMVDCLGVPDDRNEEPTLVELGSGSSTKTQRLLAAALHKHPELHYIPIDVSTSALEDAAQRLTRKFPRLSIAGYVADYRRGLEQISGEAAGPRLFVFLGSSLGNYEPADAVEILRMIGRAMQPVDRLLLGLDMAKDSEILEAAYDDARGMTAAFNLNILTRINRELGGDFDLDAFRHRAIYRQDRGRVEMHLVSLRNQMVTIRAAGLTAAFAEGESLHTENSHKYSHETLDALFSRAGLEEESAWSDPKGWFRVQRLRLSSC